MDRIDDRLRAEDTPDATRRLLLTSGYILLGLRYDDATIRNAFVRAQGMKESTTYQAILREGRQEGLNEGLVAGRQEDLLAVLAERFGGVPADVEETVRGVTDPVRLQAALRRAVRIAAIADLQL